MRVWRRTALVLAVVSTLSLVVPSEAAAASGPSVPLPATSSVSVSQAGQGNPASEDETTPLALSGEQGSRDVSDGTGDYSATSLSPSAMWHVSGPTGEFTWSYPLPAPPAPGELAPSLALSYNSGAVDGLTSSTNNQASWIGDGWNLWPGYIERNYRNCADDLDNPGTSPPLDLCWHSDNAVLSLNGDGTQLIRDDRSGVWKPEDDDGSKIERITASNDDNNNEAWKVTTTDGTQYFFGTSAASKSTWTVPVFGDDTGEPCHQATFAGSWCTQGYRWNLDKVVDRHGNMMRYFYETESNFYGRNKNSAASSYTRGGWLDHIDYGLRADDASVAASGKVEFTVADRCVKGSDCTLSKPANLPDVPLNLKCDGGSCVDRWSPSFWTTKKLVTVTTKSNVGGVFQPVDSWTLRHELPNPGDHEKPALWLRGIKHTGHTGPQGATTGDLPEVTFDGARKPNRLHGTDGFAELVRFRMNAIKSEAGGMISINYAEPDCVFGSNMPANAYTNTMRCFPVRWTPKMSPERTDYFHKYVVSQVAEHDNVAGTLAKETTYEYLDGAAWHWDTSEFVKEDKKTWNESRGFRRVRIRTGSGSDGPKTMTEQRYFRGMDGDKLPSGTRTATVTDSEGVSRADSDWLHGFELESATFKNEASSSGPDPQRIVKTISSPFVAGPTATRGSFKAYIVRPDVERTYTAVGASGERVTETNTDYETTWGLPTQVNDRGDVAVASDDLCTKTTYKPNVTKWLIEFATNVVTTSGACGQPVTFPDGVVSDTLTYYDGQTDGPNHDVLPTAPTAAGDVTMTKVAAEGSSGEKTYVVDGSSTYDPRGRVNSATDALGNTTTTSYTPAVAGPVTNMATTTPAPAAGQTGFTTTVSFDASRGLPTVTSDQNGRKTEVAYDALGRTTQVWLPNHTRANNPDGNFKFSYLIGTNGPNVVSTTKLGPNGNYTTSKEVFDGLLRKRQTQTPASGGGRLLSDVRYDTAGRVARISQPYFNDAAADNELWLPTDNTVPGMTATSYDGAGRPVKSAFLGFGTEKWSSTTSYGGDRVTVTPPQGGTTTTTITDARGRTTEVRTHKPGGYDATTYEYTPAGRLKKVTDPAGNSWTYRYDVRGRKTSETDPDRGSSTFTYDNADQLTSVTDARNVSLFYDHDNLGRATVLHRDSPTGPRLADWTYDTVTNGKGKPATSTRYVGANAYTSRVTVYTSLYQPARTELQIPAAEGALAGTYTSTFTYKPDGTLASETYPEVRAGDTTVMYGESVSYTYDDLGMPTRSWGGYNGSTIEYVHSSDYTRYGELQRLELGQTPKRAWLSYYFEDDTRRVDRTVVDAEVPNPMQADYHYTYDPAGNLTSIADTPNSLPNDIQCFSYDHLRRITNAWTPTSGWGPTTGCTTNPSTSTLGGAAPYWHSYTYDTIGNRRTETQHAAAGDTTRTYTYTGHQLDAVTTTAPGGGTISDQYDYDPTGNTTSRVLAGNTQTLDWDAEGHLTKVTETGKESSFVYDANGARLIRRDPQAVTLYLGNQEIRVDRQTNTKTATRYYTHGGTTVAVRTGSGLSWLAADHHGTAEISINNTTLDVTRRRHLPFGRPRGSTPLSWPGERGFVGGTSDASTGLTHLGAREYDPATGRFISVDPIMDPTDAQQMHGYTYSNNNPTTFTDPTGLKLIESDNGGRRNFVDSHGTTTLKNDSKGGGSQSSSSGAPWTANYLNSPVLGSAPPPLHALRARGYQGSARFTRLEALAFGMQNREAANMVCQAFADAGGGNWHDCQNAYDEAYAAEARAKTAAFLNLVYQLSPIPDLIDCAHFDGEACLGLAASAVPGGRVVRGVDKAADAANAARRGADSVESLGAGAPKSGNVAVIGRLEDAAVARGWDGHDVLNIPDWTLAKNDAWVNAVIKNRQDVYVASPLTDNLWDAVSGRQTVFARELKMFTDAGHTWDGYYLRPPGT